MSATATRRRFLGVLSAAGLAGTGLGEVLWAAGEAKGAISRQDLAHAEALLGLQLTDAERELMLEGVGELRESFERLREVPLGNEVAPALQFQPVLPGMDLPTEAAESRYRPPQVTATPSGSELAFQPLAVLAELLRTQRVTSVELTRLYLERLEQHDATLHCVISPTKERAMAQAERADAELAAGRWRGPLHGVPWGAKDLLAVRGYRTTWGAMPFKEQLLDVDAEVVRRLDAAGAVLVAKLSLGALAWGDVWYGEMTRNPWNPEQGSSGSSAGSASAVAAGLVGFAIGSETWGSIVSPATRCGASGLRPTFGRVSRAGAMALSWSMDKLGPLARSIEDCALVLEAIAGRDPEDPSTADRLFRWDPEVDLTGLRIGILQSGFERETDDDEGKELLALERAGLAVVEGLGAELVAVALPELPVGSLSFLLSAEAAAAFDDLTRSGRDDLMVRQIQNAWPNVFRQARFIPAVEYLQANRIRTLLMREMDRALAGVDVVVTPSFGPQLLATNLTGHPAAVVPAGFRRDGTPVSISFLGRLFGERALVAVARAYQEASGHQRRRPPAFV